MKLCGKMLPEKDVFMFHNVDEFTGKCIIACHSSNPDIFQFIENAAESMKASIDNHQVVENKILENNYWKRKSIEAEKYRMPTIVYLSNENTRIQERYNEYKGILVASVGNSKFSNQIKKVITSVKKATVDKVKNFWNRSKEKKLDEERE